MKKEKVIRLLIMVILILIMIPIVMKLVPIFTNIATPEGREEFKTEITGLGVKGVFIIVGLMIIQVFLIFFPGEPVEILAGMCYGGIGGLLVIYLGVFISGCLIMLLVRKFGKKFLYLFVSEERIDKIENSKVFHSKNLETVLIVLFAVPGTPKDLMTYIGAFLPIKPMKFIVISTLARFPSIISSTIVGSNLLEGNWLFIAIVYAVTFVVCGLIAYFYNKKEKIDEVMKM